MPVPALYSCIRGQVTRPCRKLLPRIMYGCNYSSYPLLECSLTRVVKCTAFMCMYICAGQWYGVGNGMQRQRAFFEPRKIS